MSNNQSYQRTLHDDTRFQLEGAVQSGAKWPATLVVKPRVDSYKGYTNSFVRLVTRTNIDNDWNNGIIQALITVQDWYKIRALIEALDGSDFNYPDMDCYERPFGRDRKPSKEPVLTAKVKIGTRDGRVYLSVVDTVKPERVKIPFFFGTPYARTPFTTMGEKGDFALSKAAALGWHDALSMLLPEGFAEEFRKAQAKDSQGGGNDNYHGNGGGNYGGGNNHGGGGSSNHDNGADLDDDLPF